MNIVRLYDQFKEEWPDLAEHTVSYTKNKTGSNSIKINLDDKREVTYSKSQNETVITLKY